jgi:hypothetical protein
MRARSIFLFLGLFISGCIHAQQSPQQFVGYWEGSLQWYQAGKTDPKVIKMQLKVFPTDTAGHYTWQLFYGEKSEDGRPYILKAKDSVVGLWVVDERNGIFLDQQFVGARFCGAFAVSPNHISICFWREGNTLLVEFLTTSQAAASTSGGTAEDIPKVETYTVKGYQRAILYRIDNR